MKLSIGGRNGGMIKSIAILVLFFSAKSTPTKDTHSLTFGIIGDAGAWNNRAQEVRSSLARSNVKNLILPGDNLYNIKSSYSDVWRNWTDFGFQFSVVAIGNHTKGYEQEVDFFQLPNEYYSRAFKDFRFIVLNSDNLNSVEEQAQWLESQIINSSERFTFVVYHHPPVTLSTRHSWKEKEFFHLETLPTLLKYQKKITAIITGHDHIASLVEVGQIPLIVSGAVFESFPQLPVSYQLHGVPVQTRWLFRGGFYWTRLDFDEIQNEVWINFVRADQDEVSCSIRINPRPLVMKSNCSRTGISIGDQE